LYDKMTILLYYPFRKKNKKRSTGNKGTTRREQNKL
jgi:hypothetical protein